MATTVPSAFSEFLQNISVTGDHLETAKARRDSIVSLLSDGFDIRDAFPTGSLVRGTALKGRADVDVLIALHYGKHIKDKSPQQVLEAVQEQLSDYRATVKKNGQAVTLYFKSWPNVDIVPASQVADDNGVITHYNIPDMNRGVWISTNPKNHDALIAGLSLRERQRIRMIKTWNHAHSSYLSSFHIETIALYADSTTDDWLWDIYQFFDKALELIDDSLEHPSGIGSAVDDYLGSNERDEVKDRLVRANSRAYEAWDAYNSYDNHREAIEKCRVIFGDQFPAYG